MLGIRVSSCLSTSMYIVLTTKGPLVEGDVSARSAISPFSGDKKRNKYVSHGRIWDAANVPIGRRISV
jgi:hypothetical protein